MGECQPPIRRDEKCRRRSEVDITKILYAFLLYITVYIYPSLNHSIHTQAYHGPNHSTLKTCPHSSSRQLTNRISTAIMQCAIRSVSSYLSTWMTFSSRSRDVGKKWQIMETVSLGLMNWILDIGRPLMAVLENLRRRTRSFGNLTRDDLGCLIIGA